MNPTPTSPVCPDCGSALPADSPDALCPACLLRQALVSRTLDGDDSPSALPPPSPEEIAGKFPQFEITECLGRGGMGVVYKARQKSLDRWVAIKILAPERLGEEKFAERFAREAATLAKLTHPNIVTVHDYGETGGLFYIVMEYIDGVNLRDLLRDGKLEPKQALAIVPPICDALQYAHDKGIVHRDIKPENLLLDRDGRIKIADFGIATLVAAACDRRTSEDENTQRRSQTAAIVQAGTHGYSAPEQATGSADHRADIYALGVVLYEMLTGERPNKELVAPSKKVQIDVRLDEIVLRALEKTPELRYQTAGEFRTVLETMAAVPQLPLPSPADKLVCSPDAAAKMVESETRTRFPRTAIVGACWLAFIPLHFLFGLIIPPGWQNNALVELLAMLQALLFWTAPLGATILGWIAVTQIRRSAGNLHGMWLAVFDGLLFPLLALDAAVILPVMRYFQQANGSGMIPVWAVLLIGLGMIALIASNVLLIRWVWRKVNSTAVASSAPGKTIAIAAVWLVMMPLMVWIFSSKYTAWKQEKLRIALEHELGNLIGTLLAERRTTCSKLAFAHESPNAPWEVVVHCSGMKSWRGPSGESLTQPRNIKGNIVLNWQPPNEWMARGTDDLIGGGTTWNTVTRGFPNWPESSKNAESVPASSQNLSFGPVMTCELMGGRRKLGIEGLNFASGQVIKVESKDLPDDELLVKWLTEQGIDLVVANAGSANWVWSTPPDGDVTPLPQAQWDQATPEQVSAALNGGAMKIKHHGLKELPFQTSENSLPTFAFRAGKSATGLLQITGFTENPPGVKIRYKLVKQTPASQTQAQTVFDLHPVIELSIPLNEDGITDMLDPETGEVIPSPNPYGTQQGPARTSRKGLLVHHESQADKTELVGMNGVMTQESRADQWDEITNLQALETLRKNVMSEGGSVGAVVSGPEPHTFLFKTGSGKIGILQITGFTENPRGVKIRYKLVQNVATKEGASAKPSAFKPIPAEAARLLAELKGLQFPPAFAGKDITSPEVMKEFQTEVAKRTAEVAKRTAAIEQLLSGTAAEPLVKQQKELLRQLAEHSKTNPADANAIHQQLLNQGKQLEAMIEAAGSMPEKDDSSIDQLVAKLSATHGLWMNGRFPTISLPQTASPEQILEQVFKLTGFDQGHVKDYKILQTRSVQIDGGTYSAALVQTDLGRKIVLFTPGGAWSRVYDAEEPAKNEQSAVTEPAKPLSQEEIRRVLEQNHEGKKVDRNTLHRALISDQTYLRASAARILGEVGDSTSVPYLIEALSDQSFHVGADYPDAGMATTRYWANESLKKLTKQDFGFVWNAPEPERQAAIKRWERFAKTTTAGTPGQEPGAAKPPVEQAPNIIRSQAPMHYSLGVMLATKDTKSFPEHPVYAWPWVKSPGAHPFADGMTVADLISKAGGLVNDERVKDIPSVYRPLTVAVMRPSSNDPDPVTFVFQFSLDWSKADGGISSCDFKLQQGDLVVQSMSKVLPGKGGNAGQVEQSAPPVDEPAKAEPPLSKEAQAVFDGLNLKAADSVWQTTIDWIERPETRPPNTKDSGEVTAFLADSKMRLKNLGVSVAWNAMAKRYEVVADTKDDPIGRLTQKLTATHGEWINGLNAPLDLPPTASSDEVLLRIISRSGLGNNVRTLEMRKDCLIQVIDPRGDPFTAALIEVNAGKRIVLFRREGDSWWSRVFELP